MSDIRDMDLRDYFAARALQGMIACQDLANETIKECASREQARHQLAKWAYMMADAMIAARASR